MATPSNGLPLPPSSRRSFAAPPIHHGPAGPVTPTYVPPPHLGFQPVHGLGVALRVIFFGWIALTGFGLWVQYQERQALQDLVDRGVRYDPFEPIVVDERAAAVQLLILFATLVTGILFLVWFRRLYRNLPALSENGRPTAYTSGWAVGWWFVPIASWWFPKTMVDEVYRRTTPKGRPAAAPPALYLVWWILFIASSMPIAAWLIRIEGYDDLLQVNLIETLAIGAQLGAAIFASVVVEELSAREHDRFDELVEDSHLAFAPPTTAPGWSSPAR